ncbi:PilZ domain-containing protein [Pseudoxanthomonas dokdonensis]|uniref:PilZ domain-containing protein n=1 Tax=Pseudoxanthomonas dokdonensis TaxID=344882 RepID=A0A0R0CJC9_9GAMM|nr:PilZ domain-containing protein [Pseudoxanthomonas dokdonensis]KRG70025.1 hypothetical protein ABB29_07230 [Pseudoxanthomonas dokdonensis]
MSRRDSNPPSSAHDAGSREARRAARRHVVEPMQVSNTMTEQVIGRVGNVSETGMLLIASVPLVEDALYQLRFSIRDARGREQAMNVGAHLLWLSQANTPGQSFAGLRFLTLDSAAREALAAWVAAAGTAAR